MTHLTLATTLALTLAAPAVAQSQLEMSLGVPAGVYTQQELALMVAKASEDGDEARIYLGNDLATRGITVDIASDFQARLAAEADDSRSKVYGVNSDPDGSVFAVAFDRLESLD